MKDRLKLIRSIVNLAIRSWNDLDADTRDPYLADALDEDMVSLMGDRLGSISGDLADLYEQASAIEEDRKTRYEEARECVALLMKRAKAGDGIPDPTTALGEKCYDFLGEQEFVWFAAQKKGEPKSSLGSD